jgi:hypothetical protein
MNGTRRMTAVENTDDRYGAIAILFPDMRCHDYPRLPAMSCRI